MVLTCNFIYISSSILPDLKKGDKFKFNLNFKFTDKRLSLGLNPTKLIYMEKKNILPPNKLNSKSESKSKSKPNTDKNCFIVTTTMGDINHPVVVDFRRYRDEVLLNTYFGRLFINIYYKVGPVLSKVIKTNSFLFSVSKKLILRLHNFIR
jgi:hypothetical protein